MISPCIVLTPDLSAMARQGRDRSLGLKYSIIIQALATKYVVFSFLSMIFAILINAKPIYS